MSVTGRQQVRDGLATDRAEGLPASISARFLPSASLVEGKPRKAAPERQTLLTAPSENPRSGTSDEMYVRVHLTRHQNQKSACNRSANKTIMISLMMT